MITHILKGLFILLTIYEKHLLLCYFRLGKLDSDVVMPLNKRSHHDLNFQKVILEVYEKIKSIHQNSSNSLDEMSLISSRAYDSEEVLSALEDEDE